MKKLITILSREAGQFCALLFCLLVLIWLYGCQSKTMSLSNNGKLVTRAEIQMELDTYMQLAEIRFADLRRQDSFKKALFNAALRDLGVPGILVADAREGANRYPE